MESSGFMMFRLYRAETEEGCRPRQAGSLHSAIFGLSARRYSLTASTCNLFSLANK
jgi:hypothetical protein